MKKPDKPFAVRRRVITAAEKAAVTRARKEGFWEGIVERREAMRVAELRANAAEARMETVNRQYLALRQMLRGMQAGADKDDYVSGYMVGFMDGESRRPRVMSAWEAICAAHHDVERNVH